MAASQHWQPLPLHPASWVGSSFPHWNMALGKANASKEGHPCVLHLTLVLHTVLEYRSQNERLKATAAYSWGHQGWGTQLPFRNINLSPRGITNAVTICSSTTMNHLNVSFYSPWIRLCCAMLHEGTTRHAALNKMPAAAMRFCSDFTGAPLHATP